MKIAMLTTLMAILASTGHAAWVGGYGATVQRQNPSCGIGRPGIERTSARAAACCDGLRCSQLLATSRVDRPKLSSHT